MEVGSNDDVLLPVIYKLNFVTVNNNYCSNELEKKQIERFRMICDKGEGNEKRNEDNSGNSYSYRFVDYL